MSYARQKKTSLIFVNSYFGYSTGIRLIMPLGMQNYVIYIWHLFRSVIGLIRGILSYLLRII